ncbi:MAG: hypothetical protein IJ237_06695 [Oscillospiraceae bacterium]|nr:hypothetical protein [Oscillospiraceae bacterium]
MFFKTDLRENRTAGAIFMNCILATISLFFNGLGVYLTIQANIGVSPWDVLNIGASKTLGILYGTASITIAYTILVIDILMREPIGLAMFIDAFVVGKAVDFFNRMNLVPLCSSLKTGIPVLFIGLVVIAYTQFGYMSAALGCGPRDTLMVGLAKRAGKIPIGAVSIALQSLVTFVGWLLGGPVGIGTLICAFCAGPIMQFAFQSMHFNATQIHHQHLGSSIRILFRKKPA